MTKNTRVGYSRGVETKRALILAEADLRDIKNRLDRPDCPPQERSRLLVARDFLNNRLDAAWVALGKLRPTTIRNRDVQRYSR